MLGAVCPANTYDLPERDLDRWQTTTLPGLAGVPLSRIRDATGLSISACSRIRSGKLTPHVRHWTALAALAEGSANLH